MGLQTGSGILSSTAEHGHKPHTHLVHLGVYWHLFINVISELSNLLLTLPLQFLWHLCVRIIAFFIFKGVLKLLIGMGWLSIILALARLSGLTLQLWTLWCSTIASPLILSNHILFIAPQYIFFAYDPHSPQRTFPSSSRWKSIRLIVFS